MFEKIQDFASIDMLFVNLSYLEYQDGIDAKHMEVFERSVVLSNVCVCVCACDFRKTVPTRSGKKFFLAHSITIFRWPPTIVHPRARKASLSLARMIVQAGNMGFC